MSTISLRGCTHFRQRLIASTLSCRPIKISGIREDDENPGLRDFEANFLRLLENLTNGCEIEINETGTMLRYKPGVIVGGSSDNLTLEHECSISRGIGWYIEGILPLVIFGKVTTNITFLGITNDNIDISVDTLRTVTLPFLKHFGLEEGLSMKVKKRGAPPNGGGIVEFTCPVVKELIACNVVDTGLVKRIRGVAYSTKVSPSFANRTVESARGLFNRLLPDVYIFTDHYSGKQGGLSPGYGLSLIAETTTGCLLSTDIAAVQGTIPEDLGNMGSMQLLEEIHNGGCIDTSNQSLMLFLMAVTPEDVNRLRLGKLSEFSIGTLRLLKEFFGITFKIRTDNENGTIMTSCVGSGYKNMNRKVC